MGAETEGVLSCQVLTMTIGSRASESEDSSSSVPDTKHNKGALEFLQLVEKAQQSQQETDSAVKFESLLIQMLDMELGEKVSTSTDIPTMLSRKGWDQAQVANVWTVAAVQGLLFNLE